MQPKFIGKLILRQRKGKGIIGELRKLEENEDTSKEIKTLHEVLFSKKYFHWKQAKYTNLSNKYVHKLYIDSIIQEIFYEP